MRKRPHLHLPASRVQAPASLGVPRHPDVLEIVRRIARWAALSSGAAAAAACAASSQGPGQDVPSGGNGGGPATPPTVKGPTPLAVDDVSCQEALLGGITPGETEAEYLARFFVAQSINIPGPIADMVEHQGIRCVGADDIAACEEAFFQATLPAQLCTPEDCGSALVATLGDEILTVTAERGQLSQLLGAIDTADEAALVAWLHGHHLGCADTGPDDPAQVETHADSFLIRYVRDVCGEPRERYALRVARDGELTVEQQETIQGPNCTPGRRPEGLCQSQAPVRESGLGRYLAEMARLEAASVVSFVRIARELRAFGAPDGLVLAALSAARDEVRHARAIGGLCLRFGGTLEEAQVADARLRDPYAFACDNASEGCVRETYGAVLAAYQAAHARDDQARQVMAMVAADEARHAQLSWQMARFIEPRLSSTQRASLAALRVATVAELSQQLDPGLGQPACDPIGLPDPDTAATLLAMIQPHLVRVG